MPSALRGIEALLADDEVGVLQSSRFLLTAAPGRRPLRRPPEATAGWDGQKASSCEQPVDGVRAGDGAPILVMIRGLVT